ncbi:ribosomal protein S7 [Panus rudis PR-1116 ss-1]|nr:ribosomal protein S7 [Panus rudis PR-1116 ss-1]
MLNDAFNQFTKIADAQSSLASSSATPAVRAAVAPAVAVRPTTQTTPGPLDIPPAEDPILHYLTNALMKHGERQKAAKRASRILLHLHAFTRAPPLPILREAVRTVAPAVRIVQWRQGAKAVVKPVALSEKRRVRYAIHWILEASKRGQRGQTVEERVAREIIAALNGEGAAFKKKEEVHKTAMQNRGSARA